MPPKPTKEEQLAYYREQVPMTIQRIQILSVLGACVLALKYPGFTGPSSLIVLDVCRQFALQVDRYVPAEVKREWDRILGTAFTDDEEVTP